MHGEGSVTLLARARGELVATLALAQARPCAHCRQVLAEMDGAHGSAAGRTDLRLIDPTGHVLRLADVYPWPFAPGDLGMAGAEPGAIAWPDLALADASAAAATSPTRSSRPDGGPMRRTAARPRRLRCGSATAA